MHEGMSGVLRLSRCSISCWSRAVGSFRVSQLRYLLMAEGPIGRSGGVGFDTLQMETIMVRNPMNRYQTSKYGAQS